MTLVFIADEAIPQVSEAFSTIGEIVKLPASEIKRDSIKSADGLLVRSITKISPSLLDGSRVKFVGTATIGTDHVDLSYLHENKIEFASAPGCSAITVAEFVLNALICLSKEKGFDLSDRVLGIIGAGNIGSALKTRAEILGISCLLNDPPLQATDPASGYISLEEIVEKSDIISLHVPLTISGNYPTYHLIDHSTLEKTKSKTIWVNTSRGGVIDESSLSAHPDKIEGLVLDVWENEPGISKDIVEIADIATSHIAGYSVEGKIRATQMVYQAACRYFGSPVAWQTDEILRDMGWIDVSVAGDKDSVSCAILKAFNIKKDDADLRTSVFSDQPDKNFSILRNNYLYRREFSACKIAQTGTIEADAQQVLSRLGFILN